MRATLYAAAIAVLAGADRAVKGWVLLKLRDAPPLTLIPGFLRLTYTENYGAAFSLFWGRRWPLVAVTGLMLAGLCFYLLSGRCADRVMAAGLTLIVAGGAGNLIDRVQLGFVVDYIDITPWFNYPIFNLADCMVCIGAVGLALYIVFFEEKRRQKEEAL